jgi:peptidoglycan/LPS O-acetylase OafA/YrhL
MLGLSDRREASFTLLARPSSLLTDFLPRVYLWRWHLLFCAFRPPMALSTDRQRSMLSEGKLPLTFDEYQGQRYFPVLDGVRALSIFGVVSFHASQRLHWLNGHQGVTFFFVLSGYLITTLLLREEQARGRVSVPGFYIRRTFRILPLYYLTLAIYCALLLGLKIQPERVEFFRRALPYYAFYFPEYVHLNGGGPFSHSWSLGIEEKFYAVWPVLGFALLRGWAGRMVLLVVLIGLILSLPHSLDWTKFIRPYIPIVVGCLTALLLHRREIFYRLRPLGARPGLLLALAGGLILLDANQSSLLVAVGCALSITSLVLAPAHRAFTTRFMEHPAVVFVGQRAYEMYLFHQAVLNIVRPRVTVADPAKALVLCVLGFAATVMVGSIAHALVGRPMTRLGRRIAGRS